MCIDAIVNGKTVETQGELEKLMRKGLVFLDGYKLIIVPDQCLCPINFESTARINDMDIIRHEWDENHSGEVELVDKVIQ